MMKTMRAAGRRVWWVRTGAIAIGLLAIGAGRVEGSAIKLDHLAYEWSFSSTEKSRTYDFLQGGENGFLTRFRVDFQEVSEEGFDLEITPWLFSHPGDPLTWKETPYDIDDILEAEEGENYKCVQMTLGGSCVGFEATGSLPSQEAGDFTGSFVVAIEYFINGWPISGDPVDIGVTDNFSLFLLYASSNENFELMHFPSAGGAKSITVGEHCNIVGPNGNATLAGCFQYNAAAIEAALTPVPEPATLLLMASGLAGLAASRRRMSRRS